jgi:hypothetical protein
VAAAAAVAMAMAGCGGDDDPAPAQRSASRPDLRAVKGYLLEHTGRLKRDTAALRTEAERREEAKAFVERAQRPSPPPTRPTSRWSSPTTT